MSTNKDKYAGKLIFQGSNDNTTFVDLFTADENIHDGWNYFSWETPEEYPKYQIYRFYGTQTCNHINEVTFTGVETVDNEDSSYTCPVKLVRGESSEDLNSITYEGTVTPFLEAISPQFGRVEGEESVTFTGTDFSATVSDYTIIIDGFECVVTSATTTSVTCTTAKRPGLVESTLYIYIEGVG